MKFPWRQFLMFSLCALVIAGCGSQDPPSKERPDGKLSVFVSIPPQAGFVKAIGGDHVFVTSFAGAGQDPHQISIQPKQMSALAKAHVYFSVDMPFEELLVTKIRDQKNAPEIVDTTQGIKLLEFDEGAHDHDHGDGHDHDHAHGESDPHIWLAPEKIRAQAITIAGKLEGTGTAARRRI